MAYDESRDKDDFDQNMERVIREHFDAEASELRAPESTWARLESRMEEPMRPSFLSRTISFLSPVRNGSLSPGFAASVAVAAVAVIAVVVITMSGGGEPESPGGMAATAPTQAPTAAISPSTTPVPAVTTAPVPGATFPPVPTQAAMASPEPTVVMESSMADEEAEKPAATPAPAPLATRAPFATPYPTPTAFHAPSPTQTTESIESQAVMRGPGCGLPNGPRCPATPSPATAADQSGTVAPSDTTFRDYQRQPFESASEDNISTFSLDTDRTSYHLALNWARNGFEVNPDSVRAEEWLNAFNYEYDPPSGSANFAIVSDLLPHPLDEGKRLARIAFQAPELVGNRPLNVTLVLDASGSMGDGNRVAIARAAAESIRQSLGDDDRIAVVHFTDDVIDRYTVGHGSPDSRQVIESISRLDPHGSTNVQAGLNLGVRMAGRIRDQRPDAYNYVILMSDGVANVDATDPFAILETAYDPDSRNPLRLITIGVGINNYNDPLLEQLAQHGNGWYRYLDSTEQAQATFARENWLALSTPFADQTRAQVTWNAGTVERWRIIGYENRVTADENFTQNRKEFAEVYSGTATTVLYELELSDSAQSLTSTPLGRVELRWMEPNSGDSRSQTANLSGDPGASYDGYDGSLAHFGAIVALAADLYSVLPVASSETTWEVHAGLSTLQGDLSSLRNDLGALDSYTDFEYLLEHMVDGLEDGLPPYSGSGYSR